MQHHQASGFARSAIPLRLLGRLEACVPWGLKKRLIEQRLNQLFATDLAEEAFDFLEGRALALHLEDGSLRITLGVLNQQFVLLPGGAEATIRGRWPAFVRLALRQEDPDSLFFQRQLLIEGDTELGLGVKNLLDSLEWSLEQGVEGRVLAFLARLDQPEAPVRA
ncbi:ubiquinone anaerobic biosynthesis accessory factor UbiT [Marinospirillum sp.]|uniref:ubiquinone anaerobic biosynthesis accessory factor UbiT n=1 Tax=Marinospirillum sp. TaxID=2183934 RepID=UPI003A89B7F4